MAKCTCIRLKTVDQRLTVVQQPVLSSGDVGTVRVEYELDSYWEGYTPSGTFYTGKKPEDVYEQPLTAGACVVPWEALQEDGVLYIGLRGVDGAGLVKTAAPVRYRVEKGSPCGTGTTTEPTPDVYQLLLAKVGNAETAAEHAEEVVQSLRDDADAGRFDGRTPVKGEDYYTPEEAEAFQDENIRFISTELAKRGQLQPEFANSVDDCTDTTKLYVLPDGMIWAYMYTETTTLPYTNMIPLAINADGTPYVGTNGEKGYKTGYRLNSTRQEVEHANRCCTGFIPVKYTDTVRFKGLSNDGVNLNGAIYFYESNLTQNAGIFYEPALDGSEFVFTPNNVKAFHDANMNAGSHCAYMRISTHVINENSIVTVNEEIKDAVITREHKWTNTGHAFVPADYEDRIKDLEESVSELEDKIENLELGGGTQGDGTVTSDDVDILIPASDVAVVGREYNIYKNTIVFGSLSVEHYDVEITINDSSTKAYNYNEVWRYTPTTAGTYTIKIKVRDRKLGNNAIYATKTMTLYVVENAAVTGKNVLFIGDSLTAAGIHTAEVQNNLSSGGITSVGTITTTRTVNGVPLTSNHEGRNGWATWDYAGTWADSLTKFQSESNVFRNPDTNQFDLGYYMQTYHPSVTLNAVCINLGTNGVGATGINVAGMSELISRIREYSATLPILVHVPIVEGVGDFYPYKGLTATPSYMKMLWFELAEAFIKEYDGTMANVHIVPVYFNLDENNDFPKTEMAVSARNPATISRITDGHPNTYGYLKMADVYYAHLLKYMA